MVRPRDGHPEWNKSEKEKVSQKRNVKNKFDIPYMWNLKWNDTLELRKQKSTYKLREQTSGCLHILLVFKTDNQQGYTVEHRELCSMLRDSRGQRGVWGRMGTWIWMAESPCCPPETITTLLISYTPIQNKKLCFFKKLNDKKNFFNEDGGLGGRSCKKKNQDFVLMGAHQLCVSVGRAETMECEVLGPEWRPSSPLQFTLQF